MNGFDYFINAYKFNYVNFQGRARRSEYWYFILFFYVSIIVMFMVSGLLPSFSGIILCGIFFLGSIMPYLAVIVRRLHDTGNSGAMFFIRLIPLIGPIWLLVLLCTDSLPGGNKYGPNPKEPQTYIEEENLINSIGEGY